MIMGPWFSSPTFVSNRVVPVRSLARDCREPTRASIKITMAATTASTALADIFPWSTTRRSTTVVYDTAECDGRFVSYHLAIDALRSNRKVLWIQGGPLTEPLIRRSLKKLGWEESVPQPRGGSSTIGDIDRTHHQSLCIKCVTVELAGSLAADSADQMDVEQYTKHLFHQVKEWLSTTGSSDPLVIMDDASTFAVLVGDVVAYQFLSSLCSLYTRTPFSLGIRCAGDLDYEPLEQPFKSQVFFGAGGMQQGLEDVVSFESRLGELADHIIDIVQMAGGPTRDVHGRILFTNSIEDEFQASTYNFSLHENKVATIRVQR